MEALDKAVKVGTLVGLLAQAVLAFVRKQKQSGGGSRVSSVIAAGSPLQMMLVTPGTVLIIMGDEEADSVPGLS